MTTPQSRINTFRASVATKIKAIMPELKSVETQLGRFDLDELERNSFNTPAVRFAIIKSPIDFDGGGQASAEMECAAFVITDGKSRDETAWAIAEAIAVTCHPSQLWGMVKLSGPSKIKITPVVTGTLKQRAVCITAVEWNQSLRDLGADIWDEEQRWVLQEVYINGEVLPPVPAEEETP